MDDVSDSATYPRNHEDAQVDALGRVVLSILFCGVLGWLWYGVGKHLIWGSPKTGVSWLVLVIACLVLLPMSVKALTSLYIGCAGFLNPALYAAWQEQRANQKEADRYRRQEMIDEGVKQYRARHGLDGRAVPPIPKAKPEFRRCLPKNPRMRKRR